MGSVIDPTASRDQGKPRKDKVSYNLERNFWAPCLHVAFPITTQVKPATPVSRREAWWKIRGGPSPSGLRNPLHLSMEV